MHRTGGFSMYQTFSDYQAIPNQETHSSWQEWRGFRKRNGLLIEKACRENQITGGRALLLGAGNGNDVDISVIESIFDEIVLVDLDESALDRFISKTSNPDKFKKVILDLSGVGNQVKPLKHMSERHIIEHLKSLKPFIEWERISGQFDFVMNCNYTTQLIGPYFFTHYKKQRKNPPKDFTHAVNDLTLTIITIIFQHIYDSLKYTGVLLSSTDTFDLRYYKKSRMSNIQYQRIVQLTGGSLEHLDKHAAGLSQMLAEGLGISGGSIPYPTDPFSMQTMYLNTWNFADTSDELRIYIVSCYQLKKK